MEVLLTKWLSRVILKCISFTLKQHYRQLERAVLKCINKEQHLKFNKQCIQHSLLPTYTNIRLHDAGAGTQPFVSKFRTELIQQQIDKQEAEIKELQHDIASMKSNLKSAVDSPLRYNALLEVLARNSSKQKIMLEIKHCKKLSHIYGHSVPYRNDSHRFVNLSIKEHQPYLNQQEEGNTRELRIF